MGVIWRGLVYLPSSKVQWKQNLSRINHKFRCRDLCFLTNKRFSKDTEHLSWIQKTWSFIHGQPDTQQLYVTRLCLLSNEYGKPLLMVINSDSWNAFQEDDSYKVQSVIVGK